MVNPYEIKFKSNNICSIQILILFACLLMKGYYNLTLK